MDGWTDGRTDGCPGGGHFLGTVHVNNKAERLHDTNPNANHKWRVFDSNTRTVAYPLSKHLPKVCRERRANGLMGGW